MTTYIDMYVYTDNQCRKLLYTFRKNKTAIKLILSDIRKYNKSVNIAESMREIADEQTVTIDNYRFELVPQHLLK